MLSKFITNLKNILFFKLIIYLSFLALLLWSTSHLKEEYNQSLIKNKRAKKSLFATTTKLHATTELKDQLVEILPLYEKMSKKTLQKTCSDIIGIADKITNLAAKYKLSEKIKIQIFGNYDGDDIVKLEKLKIKNYSLKLSFKTTDLITLVKIINDIYTIIPENSLLSTLQINNNSLLSANMINKLTNDNIINPVGVELDILIREISNK